MEKERQPISEAEKKVFALKSRIVRKLKEYADDAPPCYAKVYVATTLEDEEKKIREQALLSTPMAIGALIIKIAGFLLKNFL